MRSVNRVLALCVGLLLGGLAVKGFAASYKYCEGSSSCASSGFIIFLRDSLSCYDLGQQSAVVRERLNGQNGVAFFVTDCAAGPFHSVGDSRTISFLQWNGGTGSTSAYTETWFLVGKVDDDVSDEWSGISVQRVLALCVFSLLFAGGWLAGKGM